MNNNRAFTLIEIIVAMAVLGIISIGFLSFLSSHYTMLSSTESITQEALNTQSLMEQEIDELKDKIRKNDPALRFKTKKIFRTLNGGADVKYIEVQQNHKNKTYTALVSDIKPDIQLPIDLESIGIRLLKGSSQVNYGYSNGDFAIKGDFKNKNEHKYDHLLNVVEWYVSKEKFVIPMPKDPDFNKDDIAEKSYYYPVFPRDYILVSNSSINKFGNHDNIVFPKLNEFRGRHVIFTVTPSAKSGKIGKQSVSKAIFISGLPYTDKLIAHFDANYIDMGDDKNQVNSAALIGKWLDLSYIINKNGEYAKKYSYSSANPKVMKSPIDSGNRWQYVSFERFQELVIDKPGIISNKIYVFAVARKKDPDGDGKFLKNGTHSLSDASYDFKIPDDEKSKDWFFVKEAVKPYGDRFIIGGENIEIAELALYTDDVPVINQIDIQKYFREKYDYPDVIGEIESIDNMDVKIRQGTVYSLPAYVPAKLTRGYTKDVAVNWLDNFDVNTKGVYTIRGVSLLNDAITFTCTVTVE